MPCGCGQGCRPSLRSVPGAQVSRRRNMSTLSPGSRRCLRSPHPRYDSLRRLVSRAPSRPNLSIHLCNRTPASPTWNTPPQKTSAPACCAAARRRCSPWEIARLLAGPAAVSLSFLLAARQVEPVASHFYLFRLVRADPHLRPVGAQARREVADLTLRPRLPFADALVGGGLVLLRARQFPPRELVLRARHRPRMGPGGRSFPRLRHGLSRHLLHRTSALVGWLPGLDPGTGATP